MRILAIDGNSIMNRAYYGIRLLSNTKGFFTNALTGFMNIYLKEVGIVEPDCVAVAFDLKAPTFRHKAVSSYKANRKGMPDELAMQMPKIKEILKGLGIKVVEVEGYEADDILGTISDVFSKSGNECFILTGDRDSFQLVRDNVTVRLAGTKETKVYTPERIMEEYGVEPRQMIEIKALMGDSSDNISGVKGIGEKTALSLIQKYGNIDKLYEEFKDSDLSNGVKSKLEAGKDSAFESRFLGTIALDVPINTDVDYYKFGEVDKTALSETLSELEMFKLLEKLDLKQVSSSDNSQASLFDTPKIDLPKFEVCELSEEILNEIVNAGNEIYFIFENNLNDVYIELMSGDKIYKTNKENLIKRIFECDNQKLCFEGKEAYKFAFSNDFELLGVKFICDLAGYLLKSQASDYTIENLCSAYKVTYRYDMEDYADIASLKSLCTRLKAEIELTEMESLLYDIEQPLCEVLASMEVSGVKVDVNGVEEFGNALKKQIDELQKSIYELAGKEFNIASPKQLGIVLFEDLSLPCKKKTKSGYSTNAEVLESLVDVHPIVSMILEYRTLTKLNSTYVDGLLKQIHDDGRVHSVFRQTETRTGRISSTEPNMQNIPVRKELGRNMRKFFVADEGNVLLDADYSQIELRVLASVCGDENMQSAFINGEDIHTSTAAQVFDMPEDFVTPEMRSAAKAVNFGIIYGIGAFSLSKDIGVSVAEAKKYINDYLNHYPKVSEFMEKTVEDGKKNGYVTTVFGRRRYIPELSASNKVLQAFGKRAAMNAPIQGAAADIIKIAMVKVYQRIKSENLNARLILQVHDELIIEVSDVDKEKAKEILGEEMINAVQLAVPMVADVNEGKSWYDSKGGGDAVPTDAFGELE